MSKGTSSIRSCTRLVGVFTLPLCRLTLPRHRLHPENPGLSSRKCHGTCTNIPQTDSTMGGVSLTGGAAMSRPLTIRKPNADELYQLHQWLEKPLQSWQRRRAEVLLLYAADGSVSSIAQLLQIHRNTVSTDLRE